MAGGDNNIVEVAGKCAVNNGLLESFCNGAKDEEYPEKACDESTDGNDASICTWDEDEECVPIVDDAKGSCESETKQSDCLALGECEWE
jgi:hypothetical protein